MRKIISVNTSDLGGGAERMAWNFFKAWQRRGLESWLVVGDKKTDDPHVMPFYLSPFVDYRPYQPLQQGLEDRKLVLAELGHEDFEFPYSWTLPYITGSRPDIIHCHNLHGGYFDLRALAFLSEQFPIFLSLHDSWLLTGHCAHAIECARWETGCGGCPDLTLPPAIKRDATGLNWQRKQRVLQAGRFYVATPSQSLLNRVNRSLLVPAVIESRVIPNGIDLRRFYPSPANRERSGLPVNSALPSDGFWIVYAATRAVNNPFKDYQTIRSAIQTLAGESLPQHIHMLVIGEEQETEHLGNATIHYLPFLDQAELARYFQAADLYVHAALDEAFGLVIVEAMACGIPVVATAVSGIPELFTDGEQGMLIPARDVLAMTQAIREILSNKAKQQEMGHAAAAHARRHFDEELMISRFFAWYEAVLPVAGQNQR